jgi:hypothetical protein
MITIKYLEVFFEAERAQDEARFGELFDDHMARRDAARRQQKSIERQADADRSLHCGGDQ